MDESVATPQSEGEKQAGLVVKRRCLVVEPETTLQHNYSAALVAAGFDVIASHSVAVVLTADELSNIDPPAVMVLAVNDYVDYNEPRLLRLQQQLLALRKRWPLSSLIVLADGTPTSWLHSLAVDDLLPKIAPLATIVARCQQAARRFTQRQSGAIQHWCMLLGNVEGQVDAGLLRFNGYRPRLTLSEWALFTHLLEFNGERRSYAELSNTLGYQADPLSLMALLQAMQLRFTGALADIVELVHIPHFGYQLNMLVNRPAHFAVDTLDQGLAGEPFGLIDSLAVEPER